jgi:ATPase subunit of ABC transporter with duplicated ATPase domains
MRPLTIGVVGPCAAGKTTLVRALKGRGFQAKHIAQEHSYVPDMWQRLSHPDVLIYLDVSYPLTLIRRKLDWTYAEYSEQLRRLSHARRHADLYLLTDALSPQEVLEQVLAFLENCNATRR